MGKLLVLADKHAQLFIVNADIILHHIPGRFAVIVKIVPDKIEYHVRVVHRGSAITFLCKAVVVIPWLHHFDQFVHTMTEVAGGGIIGQHSAHFFFRKAYHFIKLGRERVVGADIEAAGEVVHGYRNYSSNETTLDAGIGSGFYFIEEGTQITFAMRFVSITSHSLSIREDSISKVVVFINEEIDALIDTSTCLIKKLQLFHRSIFSTQFTQCIRWQTVGIYFAKVFKSGLAMRIQPLTVVVQFAYNSGEIEIEHQIAVTVTCGILADVKIPKQSIELILGAYIIIMLQHTHRQALAKTMRTDKEEKLVRLFYHRNKPCLVYIITVITTDYRVVHHPIGNTFSIRCNIFFHNLCFFCGIHFEFKQRCVLSAISPNKDSFFFIPRSLLYLICLHSIRLQILILKIGG